MTKHLFRVLLATAGVTAILSLIPSRAVTYYVEPHEAEAYSVGVTNDYVIPSAEALSFVFGPDEEIPAPHELLRASVSGYTSSVDETDDTPNINAMGRTPGPGSIACPTRYAFGTRVFIAGNEYRCDDRMNPRYADGNHFDIWFASKAEAIHWGRRIVTAEVVQ